MAKVVADYFNTKDIPMLIASTAHYSKFAPEVLRFFGYKTKGQSLLDMYESIHKISKKPLMHTKMAECARTPVVAEKLLKPNYSEFVKEIKSFASKLS